MPLPRGLGLLRLRREAVEEVWSGESGTESEMVEDKARIDRAGSRRAVSVGRRDIAVVNGVMWAEIDEVRLKLRIFEMHRVHFLKE